MIMIRIAVAAVALSGIAHAAPNRAVVVGSNLAGPGQTPLQWADDDAARIRDVLVELGGFAADEVDVALSRRLNEERNVEFPLD